MFEQLFKATVKCDKCNAIRDVVNCTRLSVIKNDINPDSEPVGTV